MKYQISNIKYQNGFTLIELVVVIALFAVTSYVLVDLFLGQNRIYKTQTAELTITNDTRASLDEVDTFVRQARRILSSYSSFTTGTQTLVLEIQSINSSNQLIGASFDTVVFYYNSTSLYRQTFPAVGSARAAQAKKLAGNLTGLAFSYNNANPALASEVTTDITIQETQSPFTRSITASSKSKLRNF